jgi:hypothetical protein
LVCRGLTITCTLRGVRGEPRIRMRAADSANDYVPPSHLDVVSVQRIGSEERLEKFVTLEAGGCTCAALLGGSASSKSTVVAGTSTACLVGKSCETNTIRPQGTSLWLGTRSLGQSGLRCLEYGPIFSVDSLSFRPSASEQEW